jgi:hypothetical protein
MMSEKTRAKVTALGGLLLFLAGPVMAGPAVADYGSTPSSNTGGATTFCCSSYGFDTALEIDIGRSCTVAAYSLQAVSQCSNVSFSCGNGAGLQCVPSPVLKGSKGYGQQLEDCACQPFAD